MKIYKLSSSENHEAIRYVGYTKKKLKTRLCEHISESRNMRTHKDKWIQSQLKKGLKIIISEIDTAENIDELKQKEISLIAHYKSIGARLINGTLGGDGVVGLVQSDTLKEWNRKTKSKRIYVFDFNTKELIFVFDSITDAIKELKLARSRVSEILRGKSNVHRGFTFSYSSECPTAFKKSANPWNRGIKTRGIQKFKTTPLKAVKDGHVLGFDTVKEASNYFGCTHSYISKSR